jgi:hypothetical protein
MVKNSKMGGEPSRGGGDGHQADSRVSLVCGHELMIVY